MRLTIDRPRGGHNRRNNERSFLALELHKDLTVSAGEPGNDTNDRNDAGSMRKPTTSETTPTYTTMMDDWDERTKTLNTERVPKEAPQPMQSQSQNEKAYPSLA